MKRDKPLRWEATSSHDSAALFTTEVLIIRAIHGADVRTRPGSSLGIRGGWLYGVSNEGIHFTMPEHNVVRIDEVPA